MYFIMTGTFIFVSTCVVLLHFTAATTYKDCGTTASTIQAVNVNGCPTGTNPCPFKQNTNVTVSIQLTPNEDVKEVTNNLYGIISGVKVPFPTEKDACKSSMKCPLTKGMATTYNLAVPVTTAYPKIRLVVELDVKTDDGKTLMCIEIPAQIE